MKGNIYFSGIRLVVFLLLIMPFNLIAGTFTSHTSGSWNSGAAVWTIVGDADGIPDADDDIIITSGINITLVNHATHTCNNVEIQLNGQLIGNASFNTLLVVHGNYINNGTESNGSKCTVQYRGAGTSISGNGSFSSRFNIQIVTNRTIASNVVWNKTRWVRIYNGADLTNQGTVTFQREVIAYGANTDVVNQGTMTIRSSKFLTTNGRFHADFVGNQVIFDWNPATTGNLDVPTPQNGFYNLQFNDSNNGYRLLGDLIVANDLYLNMGNKNIDLNGFDVFLSGDFTNDGTASGMSNSGSSVVTFEGVGTQTIANNGNAALTQGFTATVINATSDVVASNCNLRFSRDLQIDGSLDMTAANHDLEIRRDLTINGSLDMHEGLIYFSGTVDQNLDCSGTQAFYDWTLDNSSFGLFVNSGTYTIAHNLIVDDGKLTTNGNSITLLANGSTSARIRYIEIGGSITGNITLRRNIPGGAADYRDMASPWETDAALTVSQWDDNLIISGTGMPDGCAYGGGCFASMSEFDATSQTYVPINNVGTQLENAKGYEIYLGDNLNTFSGALVDVTGQPKTAPGFLTPLRTGWNLLGNPYACELNWHNMSIGAGIGNFFYVYDSGTGNFEYYEVTGPGTGNATGNINANGFIASMQGFWVNSGINTNMVIDQDAKGEADPNFVKSSSPNDGNWLALKVSNKDNDYSCKSNIFFDFMGRDDYDEMDIPMFRGPERPTVRKSPMIFFKTDTEDLRKNTMFYEPHVDKVIPVAFNSEIDGRFELEVLDEELFAAYTCVYLYDAFTGDKVNMRKQSYTFTAEGSEYDQERFELILSNDINCGNEMAEHAEKEINYVVAQEPGNIRVTILDEVDYSDADYTVYVYDMVGNIVESNNMLSNQYNLNTNALAAGMYVIKIFKGEVMTTTVVNISQ